jgi:hypothetical protein
MALGIEAENLLSSSVPTCNHEQKIAMAKAGVLAAAKRLNVETKTFLATSKLIHFLPSQQWETRCKHLQWDLSSDATAMLAK